MNSWSRRRQGAIVILLMLLAFVRAAIYAAVIPPWQAPDEPQHFEYVRLVYDLGRPVSWSDRSPELLKLLDFGQARMIPVECSLLPFYTTA